MSAAHYEDDGELVEELAYWIAAEDCTDDIWDDTPEMSWQRITQAALDAAVVTYTDPGLEAAARANRSGSDAGVGSEARARLVLDALREVTP